MVMFKSTVVGTTGPQQLRETNSSEKVSRERLGTTLASESMRDSTLWPAGPWAGLWRSVSTDYSPYVTAQLFATTTCQAWRDSCRLTAWLIHGLIVLDNYPSDMVVYWFSWFDEECFIWNLTSLSLLFFYWCILPPFSLVLFFFYLHCRGMPTIQKVNTGSLWLRKVPITRRVLYARFCHPLFTPSFLEPPTTDPHHPFTPSKHFFFLRGGTLRKNVIQHIQSSAPESLLQTCSHWFSQRINCSK